MRPRLVPSLLALACVALSAASAQTPSPATPPPEATPAPVFEPKPIAGPINLQDGDTLVFLGDSITHQCLYTQYVEDYFYTRYPKRRLHFHNAGVGGDRAHDALIRFDEDVTPYKPKYVTVLLGMNDGMYRDFDAETFNVYQREMAVVFERIAALGAIGVPMTPTMFDGRAKRLSGKPLEPRDTYYNGVLALYGGWLREQAEQRGLGFADLWSPLNQLSTEQRKTAPKFTMMKDGIHPEPTGQVVMAAALVGDMTSAPEDSRIVLQPSGAALSGQSSVGKISATSIEAGSMRFDFLADALPWVLPPEATEGVRLTHLNEKFRVSTLVVPGLSAKTYELKIDGVAVGTYSGTALGEGINLQNNPASPDYQQALQVALLNQQRNRTAYQPLRDQYSKLKGKRREISLAQKANDPQLEAKKAEFETWHAQQKIAVADLLEKAKGFEDQIYAVNQPQTHHYELTPVP